MIKKLKEYEQNRHKYKDFASFFPELLTVFKDTKPEDVIRLQKDVTQIRNANELTKIPKIGGFGYDSTTVIIISTHENKDQNAVRDYVEAFNGLSPTKLRVLTDDEALKMDLSKNHLLVVGTIEGNSFMKKHISNFPISISANSIMTNKKIEGADYQLIMSWVNPSNKDKAMVFFTAQKPSLIKEYFYSPFKEGFHYWVAKNLVTIDAGEYHNWGGIWLP